MAYRLRPDRPFGDEFRAVAQTQLGKAIALLEAHQDGPTDAVHGDIHEARKKFKRVRALYRLIQSDAKAFRRRENDRIRDVARSLSAVRDATALVETVDYLGLHAASPEEIAALGVAAQALTARRDRIATDEHDLPAKMREAAAACRAAIAALDELALDDHPKRTARRLSKSWKAQRRKALAALARCDAGAHAEAFHDLRKSGQVYWMHLALLGPIWPSAMKAKQQQAKALVDLLGHEHDLSVLAGLIDAQADLFGNGETLARILGAIIARQQGLRVEALALAHEVFSDSPQTEAALIRLLWTHAAGKAAA